MIETLPARAATATGMGRVLALIVTVFLARVLAAATIVPPWQGPDEPAHFVLAKVLSGPGDGVSARSSLEPRVLESMATHGWWRYYQKPTPRPLPRSFGDVPEHLATGTLLQPAYYVVAAGLLNLIPGDSLSADYTALRVLSVLLSIAALLCGWAGTKLLFGETVALGASTIVALHPQWLLAALTVAPDALINFCGALLWWQLARLRRVTGWRWLVAAGVMCAAAVVAALSKRNGIPLMGVAVVFIAADLVIRAYRRAAWMAAGTAAAVLGMAAMVYVAWPQIARIAAPLLTFWGYALIPRRSLSAFSLDGIGAFLKYAIESSWLLAGWLRFPGPPLWNILALGLTIAGLASAAWWLMRDQGAHFRNSWHAWLFAAVHVGSLLAVAFIGNAAPQGRYFLAAAMPVAALIWIGIIQMVPRRIRGWAPLGTVAIVAALDVAAFAFVLIPVYA